MSVSVSSEDESAEARELIGYLSPVSEVPAGEVSKNFIVHSGNDADGALCVAEKDERAVIRAMLKFIRTQEQ